MNTTIIQFLIETVDRIKEKTPDYFVKLRIIALVLTILLFGVANLKHIAEYFVFTPTERWLDIAAMCDKIYPIIATVFGFTFLPKKDVPKIAKNNANN